MPRPAAVQPRLAWAAGALGLAAGLNQVVLLRELLVLAGGNELGLALALAGWLCFSALGRLLASRLPLAPVSPLPALLVAGGGGLLGLLLAAFPLLLAVAPADQPDQSRTLARVYGLEALGAALAGALFATLLVPACSPLMILLLAALLAAGVAVAASPPPGRWLALAWAMLLAFSLGQAGPWDRALRQAQWPGRAMVALAETPYAQLMATRQAGQTDFYASGLWFLSWPESQRRERLGLLPLLALPQARQALFIGGAAQGAAVQMAMSSRVRVTAVEPDPWLLDFVSAHATPGAAPDNLHVVHGDGRLFLQRAKGRFDLVVLDLPPPSTVQLNRFYSQEGLAALHRALTPQGVAVLALAGPGEGLGRLQARQMGSLLAAARASVAQVLPFWGPELLLFCAKQEGTLSEDPALWRERLALRHWPQVDAVRDDLLDQGLDSWRRRQFLETLELTGPHRPNRDLHPLALLYDPHLWGVQLGGRSALAEALTGLRMWHLALPLAVLGALLAWRARRGEATAGQARLSLGWGLLVAGCTSTAWSLLLTMVWQSAFGSLYLGLALLLGSFMLGMGGAALLAGPRLECLASPTPWLALMHWTMALGCLATLGVAHWLSLLGAPGRGYQVLVLALAALDGALTGAYFALAGRWLSLDAIKAVHGFDCLSAGQKRGFARSPGRWRARRAIHDPHTEASQGRLARLGGGLYGLDLAGGVLGACWPLLLVPSLGFGACLGLLALCNLAALAAFHKTKGT
ncbi:MAG: hypothetical protein HY794_14950 [Desulfarculus sp.]|nr:hypothetical protein [Desulfarculus sp.]